MPVIKKLTKLGDSRAVVLPKAFLDQFDLTDNAEVELTLEADRIIVVVHHYASDAEVKTSAKRMMRKHRKALERLAK